MHIRKSVRSILKIIGWFCIFFLFELVTGAVRFYSVTIDVPCMFVKYILLIYLIINKQKLNANKALVILLVFSIILIVIISSIQGELLFTLPNFLSGMLGILYGFMISRKATIKGVSILIPLMVGSFSIWYIFGKGFDHWCQLINGDTFTGKMAPADIDTTWKVYNKNNDTFTSLHYKDKIVYLDFWTTNCGVCFTKFPLLEKLYQKYKANNKVLIQAVNAPVERDTAGMAFHMIARNNKYTFPVVIGTDDMRKTMSVAFYPTIIILKNNKIVFRGRTELAEAALEDIIAGKD